MTISHLARRGLSKPIEIITEAIVLAHDENINVQNSIVIDEKV